MVQWRQREKDRLVIRKTLKESCRELQRSRLLCANMLVEKYDNFASVEFKSSQAKPNMLTTRA